MLERLRDFADLLRQNGLRVSAAELTDGARALELVGVDERATVKATLRATLVKRGAEAATFDRLFDAFFSGMKDLLDGMERSLLASLAKERLSPAELEIIAQELASLSTGPLAGALLTGQLGELARLLRSAQLGVDFRGLSSPLQRGFYARRLLAAAGGGEAERKLRQLQQTLGERGLSPEALGKARGEIDRMLRQLEEAARRVVEREQRSRDQDQLAKDEDDLSRRRLVSLTADEIDRMHDVVKRLAQKLKARIQRKRRVRRRGALSVRRTLRKNFGTGGIPMQLVFRSRRPERPEIVVLCDVSDSVRTTSRLLLQFVYTLQELYARVRSFVFVSDVGEITRHLKGANVSEAVDLDLAAQVINLSANSNYGHALSTFVRQFGASVTRRTTVLVLGDGRGNYNPPQAWALDDLRRKAKRVLWICPEDKSAWGFGDSEMPVYAARCDRVAVVRSLAELSRAVEDLLP